MHSRFCEWSYGAMERLKSARGINVIFTGSRRIWSLSDMPATWQHLKSSCQSADMCQYHYLSFQGIYPFTLSSSERTALLKVKAHAGNQEKGKQKICITVAYACHGRNFWYHLQEKIFREKHLKMCSKIYMGNSEKQKRYALELEASLPDYSSLM